MCIMLPLYIDCPVLETACACTCGNKVLESWIIQYSFWLLTNSFIYSSSSTFWHVLEFHVCVCARARTSLCRHTEADEHAIQHCFCYTSTVLTSTLAFQKEQKLKVECQVHSHTLSLFFSLTRSHTHINIQLPFKELFVCTVSPRRRSCKWPRISSHTWVSLCQSASVKDGHCKADCVSGQYLSERKSACNWMRCLHLNSKIKRALKLWPHLSLPLLHWGI